MAQTGIAGPALGTKVKALRTAKERRWSQEKLAREMEVSRETIRAIEEGRSEPKAETLRRLARALGTTPDYLLGFSTDSDTPGYRKAVSHAA